MISTRRANANLIRYTAATQRRVGHAHLIEGVLTVIAGLLLGGLVYGFLGAPVHETEPVAAIVLALTVLGVVQATRGVCGGRRVRS